MRPIFHIAAGEAWRHARAAGAYRGDSLEAEGFIHASTRLQVLEVANRLFRGRRGLVLLLIDETKVGSEIRRENLEGGEELYPHIHGPLNLDAVVDVLPFPPEADGTFRWPPEVDGGESMVDE